MHIMENFFKTSHCSAHVHCKACRTNRQFRESMSKTFEVPNVDFDCPEGIKAEDFADGKLPPLVEQAFNALKAAAKVAQAVVTQQKVKVSKEEQTKRMDICKSCDFLDTKTKQGKERKSPRCKKCGCVMKFKSMLETEHCPLKKW